MMCVHRFRPWGLYNCSILSYTIRLLSMALRSARPLHLYTTTRCS